MTVTNRIPARPADVAGMTVLRLLPFRALRKVGPWVFLDHFGPLSRIADSEFDVLPHPHCGISTVTYLLEGRTEHRDSIGGHAIIEPDEIHWMRAGHGVVHSERTPKDAYGKSVTTHGLQLWCAHSDGEEEQDPSFGSWRELPTLELEGSQVRLLAGNGWGHESPVQTTSNLVYAFAPLSAGQSIELPDHVERCVYPVSGRVAVDGDTADEHEMLVVDRHAKRVEAVTQTELVILGGDAIGPRHVWWNLVHSDRERLVEQAERWRNRDFPSIPGDDEEFTPAPDGP